VIGELDSRSGDTLEPVYHSVAAPVIRTTLETAEMVKYVNNAFHALKVTFANEIGNLCKSLGIDGREVMRIFCEDRQLNISPTYFRPGFAFGGSCLPKDLRALLHMARVNDLDVPLLAGTLRSNELVVRDVLDRIVASPARTVAMLGLSFKSD